MEWFWDIVRVKGKKRLVRCGEREHCDLEFYATDDPDDEDCLEVMLIYSPKLNAMDPSVSMWFFLLFATRGDCCDGATSPSTLSYSFDELQSLLHSPLPF